MSVTTTPPACGPAGTTAVGRAPLRLAGIERQLFAEGRPYRRKADRQAFSSDLLAAHGMVCDPEHFESARTTFQEMVEALLPRLGTLGDRFDLAVLAHTTPDSEPSWPMCFLSGAVPAAGMAFAVSDQGVSAPFSALRMVVGSGRTHGARRAQLWVADQKAIMHDHPVPDRIRPRCDAAVVLVFDEAGTLGSMDVSQFNDVGSGDIADRLDDLLGAGDAAAPWTLVCGQGLRAHEARLSRWTTGPSAAALLSAGNGMPCTGVWWLVADELPGWRRTGRRVVIADYDEELRYLSVGVLDVPAARGTEDT